MARQKITITILEDLAGMSKGDKRKVAIGWGLDMINRGQAEAATKADEDAIKAIKKRMVEAKKDTAETAKKTAKRQPKPKKVEDKKED